MVDSTKTGLYLALLRRRAGYTQMEAAEKLHISNKAVSKWESGKGLPEVTILPAVAALYGVTVDEILMGEDKGEKAETEGTAALYGSDSDGADDSERETRRTGSLIQWKLSHAKKSFSYFCIPIWLLSAAGPIILWIMDGKLGIDWAFSLTAVIWAAIILLAAGICLGRQYFDMKEVVQLGVQRLCCRKVFFGRVMGLLLPLTLAGCAVAVLMHTEEFLMPAPLPSPYIDNLPDSFMEIYLPAEMISLDLNISFRAASYLYACLPVLLLDSLLWGMINLAGKAWLGREAEQVLLRRRLLGIGLMAVAVLAFAGLSSLAGGRYENTRAIEAEVFDDYTSYAEFAGDYIKVYEGYRAYAALDGEEWPEVSENTAVIDCRYLDDVLGDQERYAVYRNVIGLDEENLTVWRTVPVSERVENRLNRIGVTGIAAGVCLLVYAICGFVWKRKEGR